jgi:hypothetical protein
MKNENPSWLRELMPNDDRLSGKKGTLNTALEKHHATTF